VWVPRLIDAQADEIVDEWEHFARSNVDERLLQVFRLEELVAEYRSLHASVMRRCRGPARSQ
jgi:hypothetical protein